MNRKTGRVRHDYAPQWLEPSRRQARHVPTRKEVVQALVECAALVVIFLAGSYLVLRTAASLAGAP